MAIEAGGQALPLAFGKDWVWAPGDAKAAHSMDAELVFVGYGITAPEEGWDDYKGLDVKGKVLVMMVNDPMPTAARTEPLRRQGPDLLRPLDLQVRGSGAPGRGRRPADPHRRLGLVRLERGAEQLAGRALPAGRGRARQPACRAG